VGIAVFSSWRLGIVLKQRHTDGSSTSPSQDPSLSIGRVTLQQYDPLSVLFVCRANVCRSAVAEFVARTRLSLIGLEVASAGTDASEGQEICVRAGEFLAKEPGGSDYARDHRAVRLSAPLVRRSALIVTASPRERSRTALLDPESRSRTFTLVELVRLLSIAPRQAGPVDLPTLIDDLHAIRWRAANAHWSPKGRVDSRWFARRRAVQGLTVRDAHSSRTPIHRPVLASTSSLTTSICDGLLTKVASPGGTPIGTPRPDHSLSGETSKAG